MYDVGFISEEKYDMLREKPINLAYDKINNRFRSDLAPHFTEHVRRQLSEMEDKYGINIYEDGLTIYTTLDSRLQKIANQKAEEHLEEFQDTFDERWNWQKKENREVLNDMLDKAIRETEKFKQAESEEERLRVYNRLKNNVAFVDSVQRIGQKIEVGFVVLDVRTGHIKAMVGGRDESSGLGLNHVTQIKRQPGSAFKPLVYTVAIDEGLYPAYPILNQPFDYNGWQPSNFEESNTGGFITLREALRNSINLVSARLVIEGHVPLWKVGIFAERMGIKTKQNLVPAISLGTADVSPLELTSAYATLANKGIYNEPIAITRIENKNGIIIDTFYPQTREALEEGTSYIITDMLQTVVNEGTALRVRTIHDFRRPAAGKTGTTQDYGDAWFVGFTPQLAGGVWVGFDDRRVTFTGSYGQGAKAAIPIWANFMKEAYEELELPIENFKMPDNGNVVTVDFCEHTIYELGNPKLWSKDCESGKVTDIIKLNDVPPTYNAERDTSIRIFDKYMVPDSNTHEAIEIIE
jgi:penicillin-binding protein 1A